MAQGLIGDLTTHTITAQDAFAERLAEKTAIFNAASGGCITLGNNVVPGLATTDTYFSRSSTAGAVRRDITSSSAITKVADANTAEKRAKQFGKYTPYSLSVSAIQNLADEMGRPISAEEYARVRAIQVADDLMKMQASIALSAAYGAIQNVSANINDQSASSVTANFLQTTLQKVGDQQGDLTHMFAHSAIRSTLVTTSITANRYDDVAPVINGADPATLGRMQVITDNSNMYSGSPAVYRTYFMRPGTIIVDVKETVPMAWTLDRLTENIGIYLSGEFEITVKVPGFTYAGADNPTDTVLATQASWTQTAVQDKAVGMVLLKSLA